MKKIYISGPMRHHQFYNFPAFDAAKSMLEAMGYEVTSPADIDRKIHHFDGMRCDPQDPCHGAPEYQDCVTGETRVFDLDRCILEDTKAILASEAVFLLPGWEKSVGAMAEVAIAKWAGKQIFQGEGTTVPEVGL